MNRHRLNLLGVWLLLAVILGTGLVAARILQGPLDDPDMAHQRPGFLDAGDLPFPAPAVTPSVPQRGNRTVVFFARPETLDSLMRSLRDLAHDARPVVIVSGPGAPAASGIVPVVADHGGRLAAAYRMRVPRDGGPPAGYAVVDRDGLVRYQTLDPETANHIREVDTIVAAVP